MPDFPIIDSHVHLYDIEKIQYSWMADVPSLNKTTVMRDFDIARGTVAVEGLVFVEVDADPGFYLDEAKFVASLAENDSRISAIVAHAPLEKGLAVKDELEKIKQIKNVKGIRRLIQGEHDPSMCIATDFIEAVRLLSHYDLSFDICIRHYQLTYAIELVRRCPNTRFILDHIAKPDIKNGLLEPWKFQIRELAELPNVVCKISGVATEADHSQWTRNLLRPYIEHVIESFGFSRVMFGSDWTVATLAVDYPTWVNVLDDVLADASSDERNHFWRKTAIEAYNLPFKG